MVYRFGVHKCDQEGDEMSKATATMSFGPDWVSPPGDTIADLLHERDWTQAEFATRLGTSREFVDQLVSGHASIDEAIALRLERVLGSTTRFWLNREADYRAGQERGNRHAPI